MSPYARSFRWLPYSLACLGAWLTTTLILVGLGMPLGYGLFVYLPFAAFYLFAVKRSKVRFDQSNGK